MKNVFKYNRFILIVILCVFTLNCKIVISQTVDQKRDQAIKLYNKGETKKSILLLTKLAKKENDSSSMLALGRIYLKNKKSDKAFYWMNASGIECNKSALSKLKIFYQNKSSKYFNPYKYSQMIKNCSPKSDKKYTEKNKNKKNRKNNKTIRSNRYNKIDERVAELWGKIAQVKGKIIGRGSGFSIMDNGYFLTNHHVIEKCNEFGIRYNKLYGKASLINFDKTLDIALLKVNAPTPYYVKFNSAEYIAGEEIFIAGFPLTSLTGSKMSINQGIITNPELKKIGKTRGLIFISAPVASGNSGGPVINKYGQLRGVVIGGMNRRYLKKQYEDKGAHIGNSTFSLMISGNLVKLWLEDINIEINSTTLKTSQREPEVIGKIAEKYIAKIECY